MNALQKDLIKLTAAAEQAARPRGPWGLQLHLMPPAGSAFSGGSTMSFINTPPLTPTAA